MSDGNLTREELSELDMPESAVDVNEEVPLADISSIMERAFEDSKRDNEEIYLYTSVAKGDASYAKGVVVGYDERFVVLVEGDGKLLGAKLQQQIVRRNSIVMMRSAYNMLKHTS